MAYRYEVDKRPVGDLRFAGSRYEILQFADDGSLTRQELPPWLDVHVTGRQDVERKFNVEPILKELEGLKIPEP